MLRNIRRQFGVAWALAALGTMVGSAVADPPPERAKSSRAEPDPDAQKSGEELWSANCRLCHNIRPANAYSDAQWDVIMHHMRVRAFLTGQEQRAIADFLKSSN